MPGLSSTVAFAQAVQAHRDDNSIFTVAQPSLCSF